MKRSAEALLPRGSGVKSADVSMSRERMGEGTRGLRVSGRSGSPWRLAGLLVGRLGLGVLCGLGPLLAAGCDEPTGPEREISGARLFLQNCARCHGVDGKGVADAPPGTRDLTDRGQMSMLTDQQIKRVIQMGRPPNMPAFGRQFAEPSMKVLVAYVRGLSAAKPVTPATPAAAEAAP